VEAQVVTTTELPGEAIRADIPLMADVVQDLPVRPLADVQKEIHTALGSMVLPDIASRSVAVLVGSRGIAHIKMAVLEVIDALRERGATPFLVPAMGSHGGGTSEGQEQVLIDFGLDPARTGVEIRSSLQTTRVGTTPDGQPAYFDANAAAADYIFIVARVKPHTTFLGDLQSGLAKLLVVGGGKVDGARTFHMTAMKTPHSKVIDALCRVMLENLPILGGLALVEDAQHDTAIAEFVPAAKLLDRERELLDEAKALMPSIPVDEIDVLVVDQIGKDVSGSGMDPNLTGRRALINARWQEDHPQVTRIVVLDLTDASHGNAIGIGMADFAGPRIIDKMDRRATYLNSITSMTTVSSMIPLYFPTDRETIDQALMSLVADGADARFLRIVHIRNTLDVARFSASQPLLEELRNRPGVRVSDELRPIEFLADGTMEAVPASLT
jgi:hypothetical protein